MSDTTDTTASSNGADSTSKDSSVSSNARTTHRKTREGLVVSNKMDKTVVVSVEDRVKHALYGKVLRRTSKLKAHDEMNQCDTGDRVLIMETRPLSATKRWRVVEVLEKAK
jgi:small subunit ribosomal protein S17